MYGIFNLDNPEEKSGCYQIVCSKFGKGSRGKARMVLVEGSPGIGKTTFCLKIANDWVRNAIPKKYDFPVFKLMLLLKCRDMDGDVMQAIDDQLLPEDIPEKKKKELLDYIWDEKKQEKILIILDGLDELPQKAEQFVDKLLRRKVLPHCSVLATSRQEKGIEIRQGHAFDILLQINGFTIEDASEYIRKHFRTVGQVDLLKGERLIQAIQENTFLQALRRYPLNLLLLCIIFEDHEGKLPSNCTKLYQIIYCCLLRRFCSKNDMEVDKDDDKALEERFEDSMLLLGELAWRCLVQERPSFLQEELYKLEKVRKSGRGVSAARMGLVFLEASVKKLNPKHEYHFLHRTFQEFLAGAYLVQLMKGNISNFDNFQFNKTDVTTKYRQVFLFVAGILGKDGIIFFKHIGKILNRNWNWHSSEEDCRFLVELLNESGAPHDLTMVPTICQCIPLPQSLELSLENQHTLRLVRYAYEASSLASNVEPLLCINKLSLTKVHALSEDSTSDLQHILENSKTVKDLVISTDDMTTLVVDTLSKGLSSNLSLSSLTLKTVKSIPADLADMLGTGLSLCNSLTTVKLKLFSDSSAWACDVCGTGLLKSTQLESVNLEYYGVPGSTAVHAFKMLVSKRSLICFSLTLFGDMEDCFASALSEGLSEETTLNSFTVVIHGSLSNHGATLLANGFLLNRTLHTLVLKVLGDLPECWAGVVDKIHILAANKSWKSLTLHPNVQGEFVDDSFRLLNPISRVGLLEKTLTINLCGKLSIHNVEILGDCLLQTLPLSSLTLNVNGNMSNEVADCLANVFVANSVPLSLTILLTGKISSLGQTALQRLHRGGQLRSFILNVDSQLTGDWECLSAQNVCSTPSALSIDTCNTTSNEVSEIFSGSKSLTELSVTVHNHVGKWENWGYCLGKGLAQIESLTSFSLTVHNYTGSKANWGNHLCEGLSNNKSLTTFSLTVHNYPDTEGSWERGLCEGLMNNKSLTTFSLTVHNYAETEGTWGYGLGKGLSNNKSLTTFSLTVNDYANTKGSWGNGLGEGLLNNKSLTSLTLTVHDYADTGGCWGNSLGQGLSNNKSLTTFSLTVHNYAETLGAWGDGLGAGLSNNKSLTAFSLVVHDYADTGIFWEYGLGQGLSNNNSLTTFSLAVHNYVDTTGTWGYGLGEGLSSNKSLTTFSLAVHNYASTKGRWGHNLAQGLSNNNSLTTFSLTIHNYADTLGIWGDGLGTGLSNNKSLTAFSLTVHNYVDTEGFWGYGLGQGLSHNKSLTTFNLTVHNYVDTEGSWGNGLSAGLSGNKSLTTFSLTVHNYAVDTLGNWGNGLCEGLSNNKSLTTFILTVHNYADTEGSWGRGLGAGLSNNKLLTTFILTVHNYIDTECSWEYHLANSLAKSCSLTTIRLAINDHTGVNRDLDYLLCKSLEEIESLTVLSISISFYGTDIGKLN